MDRFPLWVIPLGPLLFMDKSSSSPKLAESEMSDTREASHSKAEGQGSFTCKLALDKRDMVSIFPALVNLRIERTCRFRNRQSILDEPF